MAKLLTSCPETMRLIKFHALTNRAACATFHMWQVRRAERRGVVCHTKDVRGTQTKVLL